MLGIICRRRRTRRLTSVLTVEHLADSTSGPSGCPHNREIPDSKVPKPSLFLRMKRFKSKFTNAAKTIHTPIARRVVSPTLEPHDSCTACIVGVAKGTSAAMTSDSTVAHLPDSFQVFLDTHTVVKHLIPKSKESPSMMMMMISFICSCTEKQNRSQAPYIP